MSDFKVYSFLLYFYDNNNNNPQLKTKIDVLTSPWSVALGSLCCLFVNLKFSIIKLFPLSEKSYFFVNTCFKFEFYRLLGGLIIR